MCGPVHVGNVDLWLKDAAPSRLLRKWFDRDPEKWEGLQRRYRAELDGNREALRPLLDAAREGRVTLVHGAHDREHNKAVVLEVLSRSALKTLKFRRILVAGPLDAPHPHRSGTVRHLSFKLAA